MKRILLSIVVIGILLLSACGAPTTAPPAEAPPTPSLIEQQTYTLSITISPSGAGSVSPSDGQHEEGTRVTLTATPASVYTFDYWNGDASGTSPTITVTMDSDKSVTAHFKEKEVATYSLSVSVQPSGSGSVTPSSGDYSAATDVTLVPTAAPGYEFDHWSGDASGSSPTTTITMASNRSIIAHFKVIELAVGLSRDNPLPMGKSLVTPEGIEITVVNLIKGNQAWEIIHEANMFNDPPAFGMQYIIITVKVKNISSEEEPESVSDWDFELIGSSNKVFHGTERSVVLPDEGSLSGLWVDLYHGGEETGSLDFYVPADETNLVLIWDFGFSFTGENKRFFEVRE